MRLILRYFFVGIAAGWLLASMLAARGENSPTGSAGRIGAALGGILGLAIGAGHAAVAASCRASPPDPTPDGESDRLLIRGTLILLVAASPIAIHWVIRSMAPIHTSHFESLARYFFGACGCAVGAYSIWCTVRWFNRRDDSRFAKLPPIADSSEPINL